MKSRLTERGRQSPRIQSWTSWLRTAAYMYVPRYKRDRIGALSTASFCPPKHSEHACRTGRIQKSYRSAHTRIDPPTPCSPTGTRARDSWSLSQTVEDHLNLGSAVSSQSDSITKPHLLTGTDETSSRSKAAAIASTAPSPGAGDVSYERLSFCWSGSRVCACE